MSFRWPQPDTEQAFEQLCLEVLKVEWKCRTLELYAKRGERQYGIDIISPAAPSPFRVAQCKLHEPGKRLTKAVILAEIEKAKQFPSCKIDHYLILTTGDRSGATQNAVIEINQEHAAEGHFSVEVHGWDWIESILDANPSLMRHTHPQIVGAARMLVLEEFASHQGSTVQMVGQFLSDVDTAPTLGIGEHDADIDEARRLLDDGSEDVARALLQRLRDRVWDRLTSRQKFRVVTYLGVSYMATDDQKRAGDLLVEGASYEPSTEKSDVNRAIGLELRGDTEAAYLAAESAFRKYPSSGRALAARIRCAPSSLTWEELSSWITADIAPDTDVGIALALRAMQIGRPEEAVSWSARAVAAADHSSRAQSLAAR